MEDEQIVQLFFSRAEQAIQELDRKYGTVFYAIAHRVLNNRQDEEECVNDAYMGVWNTIPPARPNPLHSSTSGRRETVMWSWREA